MTNDVHIVGVLLCAGSSSRFKTGNKLLHPLNSMPLVTHSFDHLLNSRVDDIVVVTGHDSEAIEQCLQSQLSNSGLQKQVQFTFNSHSSSGMASSIKAGCHQARQADAIVLCLGDMPQAGQVIDQLIKHWMDNRHYHAVVPVLDGRQGHPVLFSNSLFEDIQQLRADVGARAVLRKHTQHIAKLSVQHDGIFRDYDTESAFD